MATDRTASAPRTEPIDTLHEAIDAVMPALADLDPDWQSRWSTAALLTEELRKRGYELRASPQGQGAATASLRDSDRQASDYDFLREWDEPDVFRNNALLTLADKLADAVLSWQSGHIIEGKAQEYRRLRNEED